MRPQAVADLGRIALGRLAGRVEAALQPVQLAGDDVLGDGAGRQGQAAPIQHDHGAQGDAGADGDAAQHLHRLRGEAHR